MQHRDTLVSVWWRSLASFSNRTLNTFDGVELDRFDSYRQQGDRHRFALGAEAVRIVGGHELGIDPAKVEIDRRCRRCSAMHGVPSVLGTDLRISVTHAGGLVGVAWAHGVEIGLDVEDACSDFDLGVVGLAWSHEEWVPRNAEEFFRTWTRKESVVKATGDGISVGLKNVVVSAPIEAPELRRYSGNKLHARMFDLVPREDYCASLCVLSTHKVVVEEYFDTWRANTHQ